MIRILVTIAVILTTIRPPLLQAAGPDHPPKRNAALVYWQAFYALPKISEAERELLAKPSMAKEGEAAALMAKAESSLGLLLAGSALRDCDWELDYSQGFAMPLPHLGPALNLARLACLRARQHGAKQEYAAAVDDLRAALVLGRRISSDPVLVCLLVDDAIEAVVLDAGAALLPRMDEKSRASLEAAIAALPARPALTEAMKLEERMGVETLERKIADGEKAGQPAIELVKEIRALSGEKAKPASDEELLTQWKSEYGEAPSYDGLRRAVGQLQHDYEEIIRCSALPRDRFRRELAGFNAKLAENKSRPEYVLTNLVTPALDKARLAEDVAGVRLALFAAAGRIVREGDGAASSLQDPMGHGPFAFRRWKNGFSLASELQRNDQPVTLTVGAPE